ncbi:MAG TPA: hypothetical protein VGL89_18500 [Candidatus Koribacter sp.]|jgi:NDP-sugar pyrophosphorylase family protein
MDVRAVIVVGNNAPSHRSGAESFAGMPFAFCDVLGKSVLARTIQRLQHYGIAHIVSICEQDLLASLDPRTVRECNVIAEERGLWRCAESVFNDLAQKGAEVVLVIRLGAYAEIDYEEFIQYHLEHRGYGTVAVDARGYRIGAVAICGSRRNHAAYLFRHNFEEFRLPCEEYTVRGYINRLVTPTDFRQLTIDSLLQQNQLQPIGAQIRPGVWAAPSAHIHPRARIVAPAYIGDHVKLRASAVVTRFSSLEHHAVVDCGTVIENTSVAPYTYIGCGLDLNYSLVGNQRIANLRRDVEVEIQDPKLIANISSSAPLRALRAVGSLTAFLPQQIIRGLFASSPRTMPSDIPAAIKTPTTALQEPTLKPQGSMNSSPEFPSDFAVVRRYGNE